MLFSTRFINSKGICKNKHILSPTVLDLEISGLYKLFNPSITRYDDGYMMCVRYSNKTIKNLFMYMYSELEYKSFICFIKLDFDMKIKNIVFPILKDIPLEDPRISYNEGKFYVSITEFNSRKDIHPALYIFNKDLQLLTILNYNKNDYHILNKPSHIQKNWCPFFVNNIMYLHTDTYPNWNVYKINSQGNMVNIINYDSKRFFHNCKTKFLRCSTSWKSFSQNTYICGLHTKDFTCHKFLPTIRTVLVEIDKNTLLPIRKTPIFCIDNKDDTRVQFLSGIEVDDYYVYLTYGIGDYKIFIKKISKNHISNLLI
jgi:hypothetical protein